MKIEKEGVIAGFQGGINIYVDKGHSMKVFKSLNQLTYGELKVGDSYLVDASYGLEFAVDNLKKCKLKEIRGHGSSYNFIFELTEYDEDLKIIEMIAHYLYDKSTAYAYNFIIGKQESFNNLNITTIKYKNEKLDMIFNLTIDSNGKITSLKKKYK